MRLFASTYPHAVSGLVLVDPTPTTFLSGECAIVSATLCQTLREGWAPSNNPEGLAYVQSSAQVERAGPLPSVPMIVLAATDHHQDAITDPAIERQIEVLWRTRSEAAGRQRSSWPADRRTQRSRHSAASPRCDHLDRHITALPTTRPIAPPPKARQSSGVRNSTKLSTTGSGMLGSVTAGGTDVRRTYRGSRSNGCRRHPTGPGTRSTRASSSPISRALRRCRSGWRGGGRSGPKRLPT